MQAASSSTFTFGAEGSWSSSVVTDVVGLEQNIQASHNIIGNGYFATMGIPLIAGSNFSTSNASTSTRVAILSQHTAKILFPQDNPSAAATTSKAPKDAVEVIGVVKDVKTSDVAEDPRVIDYLPYTQSSWGFGNFQVRYGGDFAAIGIYGLRSYVVSRCTNEIGIRMALGAPRSNVSWLVMREIALLVAIGTTIGIPAALAADRLVANMLFGVKSTDPAALLAAPTHRRCFRRLFPRKTSLQSRPHGGSTLRIIHKTRSPELTIIR